MTEPIQVVAEAKPVATEHAPVTTWIVYMIQCNDNSLYTGVTTDLQRRFNEHLTGKRGARYFNGRRPSQVVYCENGHTRSSACQREAAIKKLSREEKLRLIKKGPGSIHPGKSPIPPGIP